MTIDHKAAQLMGLSPSRGATSKTSGKNEKNDKIGNLQENSYNSASKSNFLCHICEQDGHT